jgi:hypothetical protein
MHAHMQTKESWSTTNRRKEGKSSGGHQWYDTVALALRRRFRVLETRGDDISSIAVRISEGTNAVVQFEAEQEHCHSFLKDDY